MISSHFDELFIKSFMIGVVIGLKCVVMTMIKLLIAAAFLDSCLSYSASWSISRKLNYMIFLPLSIYDAISLIATFFLCEKNLPQWRRSKFDVCLVHQFSASLDSDENLMRIYWKISILTQTWEFWAIEDDVYW